VTDPASSFGPAADIYERGRPTYPAEALDWLLPAGRPRVVDVGAGTGKLTRQIRARGLPVTAVDPSDGMLTQLRHSVPGVPALLGSAEDLPLPDASADAVVVAQAWHWVDPARAVPEVARVLRPGGRLGLIWNYRDESAGWVSRLSDIIGRYDSRRDLDPVIGPPFGATEAAHFTWTDLIGPERLIDMVASRSQIILMPPDERAAVLGEVRRLMATHPDMVGRTEFTLPYRTECLRATLPAA
jgi:SAM-dependent methyltransferase